MPDPDIAYLNVPPRYNDCTDSTMKDMRENLEKVKGTAATDDRIEEAICDGINKVRRRMSLHIQVNKGSYGQ